MKQINLSINLSRLEHRNGLIAGTEKAILLPVDQPALNYDPVKKSLLLEFKAFPYTAQSEADNRTHIVKPKYKNFDQLNDEERRAIPIIGDFIQFEKTGPQAENNMLFSGQLELFALEYTITNDTKGRIWAIIPIEANNLYSNETKVSINIVAFPSDRGAQTHILKQSLPKDVRETLSVAQKNRIIGNLSLMQTRTESTRLIDAVVEII
jgi:hypothetical protein